MADQPFDVRKAIEQSSSKSTLQELAKKGIHRVKVLDEHMINRLIGEAVERIISTKTNLLSSDDRQKLIEASRKELDRLMKEHQATKDKAELMERSQGQLAGDVENLQEQLKQTRKIADDTAKQRYEDGKNVMRAEIEDMKKKFSSIEEEAEKRLRKEIDMEYKLKMAEQMTAFERDKATYATKAAEDGRKQDEELVLKLSELFTKSLEGVNKKLNDIRLKAIAGGGIGGGGGGGRMEGDLEFRPSQATLESLVQGELESNLKGMQAEAKVSGKIGSALERLKAMRGGGGGGGGDTKKEEKK
jgi:hypothetical protein